MKNTNEVNGALPLAPFHPLFSKGCYDPGKWLDSTLLGMGPWKGMTCPVRYKIFWKRNICYDVKVAKSNKPVQCCKQNHLLLSILDGHSSLLAPCVLRIINFSA